MKSPIPLIIALLLISTSIFGVSYVAEELSSTSFDSNIFYVGGDGPGNYSRIQDAINDASDGDTVFVYNGIYVENLIVYKSINLIGENRNTTIIDGNKNDSVVQIDSDWVYIKGFSIQNSGSNLSNAGINICSNYNTVKYNNILNNRKGIQIQNSSNNITSNNISNNDYGIWPLTGSNSNIVINNTIRLNRWWGIYLEESEYNFFSDNDISNNGNGINLEESDSNYFSYNVISDNWYGMELYSSSNTTILGNIFLNDDLYVYDSYQNTVFNNTVDGKPLIYLEDESDIIIDDLTGQIILINCVNISIQNQEFSNMIHSIELWGSNYCLIFGNTIVNNHFGIVLIYSSYNTIVGNNISNNSYGIVLQSSGDNNTIFKNTIRNNGYGIALWEISNTTFISWNKFSKNGHGVQVYKSNNTFIENNTFSNDFFGVYLLFKSYNNIIFSNDFLNCGQGIWFHLVSDNKFFENTIIASDFYNIGIWLLNSNYNTISNNTITDCLLGIELLTSYRNTILDNIFFKGGISVYDSFDNTISSNLVNDKPLVYLEDKSDINVEDAGQVILVNCTNIHVQNQDLSNTFFGVELWESSYCYISNNTMSNNYHSFYITYSHNNSITGNNILNYYFLGVDCFSSNDNTFSDNVIRKDNEILERLIFSRKISIVFNNTFYKNNFQKIQLYNNPISNIVFDDLNLITINSNVFQEINEWNTSNGISFVSCCNNIISGNIIQKNHEGIIFQESNDNIIRNNTIKNNDRGIFFDKSFQNTILKNNFIKNKRHAFFIECKNSWRQNYWNRLRFFPKPIFGKINIWFMSVPWINIDWRPAKEPYDI